MNTREATAQIGVEFELRFETLLGEMMTQFLNLPSARIDKEIENSILRAAEFLGLDEGLLIQWRDDSHQPQLTHHGTITGSASSQDELDFPATQWICSKLLSGEVTAVSRMADLPPEVAAFYRRRGRRSLIAVPLKIGGEVIGGLVFATLWSEVQWSSNQVQRLELVAEIFAGVLERKRQIENIEMQLQFESLLKEISSRFVNVSADQVHATIEEAQRLCCESLNVDRSSLFQCSASHPGTMLLTHLYQRPDLPYTVSKKLDPVSQRDIYWREPETTPPGNHVRIDCRQMFPWFYDQLRDRRTVVVPDLQALGDEAAVDRKNLSAYGTKSTVVVPLFVGETWLGILTFGAIRQRHDWSENQVKRFQFLGDLFTNALARERSDSALRESESRYRSIFESESDAVLLADCSTGRILNANAAALKMYGYTREEFLSLSNVDLRAESGNVAEDSSELRENVLTTYHQRSNGEEFPVEISISIVQVESDERRAYVTVVRDITERVVAEKALAESRAQVMAVMNSTNDFVWSVDARNFRLLTFNAALQSYFSRAHHVELKVGMTPVEMLPPDNASKWCEYYDRALCEGSFTLEYTTASAMNILLLSINVMKRGGEVFGLSVFGKDITERIRARRLIEESEQRFRQMAENIREMFFIADLRKPKTEYISPGYEEIWGRSCQSLYEDPYSFLEAIHPDDRDRIRAAVRQPLEGKAMSEEYRVVRPDGSIRWVWDRSFPLFDVAGGVTYVTGLVEDITERKCTERLLRESEARFRTVADSAPVLIWMSGPDRLRSFFTKTWLDFTGRTLEQEQGNGWMEGVHQDDLPKCVTQNGQSSDEHMPFQMMFRLRRRDGEYRWMKDHGVPRYDTDGSFAGYIGSCADVTESKLAEDALQNSFEEIQRLKDRLQAESEYLRAEIKVTQSFGEIVGQSDSIRRVLHQVEQVAPAECPVLITGETGTGKELVARAIHHLSSRRDRAMVKVNCAALPSTLVESELFGRERGAFTGASTSQMGRFEVANHSTIFLDEVGDLPLEVQAKLLRVLQEGEFERLGSPRTCKVNTRLIAATNRDLAEEVRQGRFREDLFYRLSVFPIKVPPLRERSEDIPDLVSAFVAEFSSRMGRRITNIPRRTMEMLQRYSWPGNIRELRNVLEHGVILSAGEVLRIPHLTSATSGRPSSLAEMERDHILKTMEQTGGRIKGRHGAAELLGLHPATLYSRMRKLGIPNRRQKDDRQS